MNRVIHFEIHAAEPEKAAGFYSGIFGWKIEEWKLPEVEVNPENRYWMVETDPEGSGEPGIGGGIMVRQGEKPKGDEPVSAFICTISVPDLDAFLKKVEAAGGKTAVGKMPIMGYGWLAYCLDPDGNKFGMMQMDPEAK